MKVSTAFNAIGFGLLLCGSYTTHAQPRFYTKPFVVQLAEIDRYHLYVDRPDRRHPLGRISLYFKDLDKSQVHQKLQHARVSNNWILIMEGRKLLVQCSLAGGSEYGDADGNSKYGFLLGFSSAKDAEKAGAILKLAPDSKEADSKREK
jgi:hypothetical protein